MPVQLTMCRFCIRSRPEVQRTVAQLVKEFPNQVEVEELDCMAACDDVPAIMIETDYHPQVAPCELARLIRERLTPQATSAHPVGVPAPSPPA
ncbi:NAD(P)H-dependent oxidoreductase subunit E [Candidatus Chloroploca sp. M-50]|uniref:NAD(P)H-dependent oxidoreductase subunit E n=1 Tax=Candidatus Chloroploca mongolica TaxID=2528176 RepID=A0ABS4D804_9CHLR|nr:NAD(P)H-dependent oxidoreductase subunit E [Candidatus Chloroploca mongolica]MBP1465572.1 NAD(P)H-dependent oxidoreductase subunit E [Candidatus Chloroploca mongolica]